MLHLSSLSYAGVIRFRFNGFAGNSISACEGPPRRAGTLCQTAPRSRGKIAHSKRNALIPRSRFVGFFEVMGDEFFGASGEFD